MTILLCAGCSARFALGLPILIDAVWYARCPTCNVENELTPVLGRPGEDPSFAVVKVRTPANDDEV